MKRSIKLAVAAAVALSATSAFATNGDNLIGMGAKARGMGGIGIGMSHGAESALANPALITSVKGTEVSFGGTIFMPDVEYNGAQSDADLSVIPEVAIAQKASDNFWWGVGMFGTAGMGTDYRKDTSMTSGTMNMVTNLQLMQFAVPLAFKAEGFSIGIAPVLQYGSLDINYDMSGMGGGQVGSGVAQDFGFGYNIGAAYEMSGLTLGASYKSAIDMSYDGVLSSATTPFGPAGMGVFAAPMADDLEQPAEMGIGASYTMAGHTFAVDYKRIEWSDAKGYKDFKWDDQDVIILGYQYAQDNWAVRLGYNHSSSPIKDQSALGAPGLALNMFNLLGFPATVEDHYTVGGSYAFSKMTSLDLAYTYADEAKDSFANISSTSNVKHSQQGVSAQLNFNF
ncbi:MAG: porin [Sulfuricurvum sp.]|nr:porin [Sulfuricurvum sp.]